MRQHAQQDPSDRFKGGEVARESLGIFGKWREKGKTARESQAEGRDVNACCCHERKLDRHPLRLSPASSVVRFRHR